MKITDIIRGILDLADVAIDRQQAEPVAQAVVVEPEQPCDACGCTPCACEQTGEPDLLAIIQQLAGVETAEPEYANEPKEVVASIGASYPGGDDMHNRKNPADIRSNATSMYPGFQAEKR
jgi:hypothetical protein